MRKIRIVYFGSGAIGIPTLRTLIHDPQFEVAAVVTRPDAPAGRKMELCPTPVCRFLADEMPAAFERLDLSESSNIAEAAREAGEDKIRLLTPGFVRGNKALRRFLEEVRADALVVISYGQILTNLVLNKARWAVCVHTSALPKLRGASPVRTALLLGLETTEVCTFLMTPRMDDGDVLLRRTVEIAPDDDFQSLCKHFSEEIPALVSETLTGLAADKVIPRPQDESLATYTRMIHKEDAWIDWNAPAQNIWHTVRAFTPDMGAITTFRGRRVKFEMPAEVTGGGALGAPGEILKVDAEQGCLEIAGGTGILRVFRIQPDSRPWLNVGEFINGFSPRPGEIFEFPDSIAESREPLVFSGELYSNRAARQSNAIPVCTDAELRDGDGS